MSCVDVCLNLLDSMLCDRSAGQKQKLLNSAPPSLCFYSLEMASPFAHDTHAETGNARVGNTNPLNSEDVPGSLCSDSGVRSRNEQRQESSEPNTASSCNTNWEDQGARPKTKRRVDWPLFSTPALNAKVTQTSESGLSANFIFQHTQDEALRRSFFPHIQEHLLKNFYSGNWERAQPNHTQTQRPVDPPPWSRFCPVSKGLSGDFIARHTQGKSLQHEENVFLFSFIESSRGFNREFEKQRRQRANKIFTIQQLMYCELEYKPTLYHLPPTLTPHPCNGRGI